MHELLPSCEIHVFDHTVRRWSPPRESEAWLRLHTWGIGSSDRWIKGHERGLFTFPTLQRMLSLVEAAVHGGSSGSLAAILHSFAAVLVQIIAALEIVLLTFFLRSAPS